MPATRTATTRVRRVWGRRGFAHKHTWIQEGTGMRGPASELLTPCPSHCISISWSLGVGVGGSLLPPRAGLVSAGPEGLSSPLWVWYSLPLEVMASLFATIPCCWSILPPSVSGGLYSCLRDSLGPLWGS